MNVYPYLLVLIRASGLIFSVWLAVVGYLVAPLLFAELEQVIAGRLVGELLTVSNLVAMGGLLAVGLSRLWWFQYLTVPWMLWIALVMMAFSEFWIAPYMEKIKALYPQGVTQTAPHWGEFMMWHGVYQLLFLSTILVLALWSVLQLKQNR